MLGHLDEHGKYVKGKKPMLHNVNPLWKDWSHNEQRKRYSRDLVQPYVNGEPNREFVNSYPEESKTYFNEDEIKQAERRLNE